MDETTTGSSTTTATRPSTRTRATPIPARSGATSNTTSRLETRPARSSTDLGSTEMGTSGATSRSAPPDSLEVSWAIPSCSPGSSPWSSQSSRWRSGRAADHGSLRNHRPSDIAPAQSTQPRSLLIASPYATPVTRLSDIGERGAIDILAIAGTAFGRIRKDRILLRTGARPGDAIVVTGDLGRAGHATKTLEQSSGMRTEALNQLLRPYPRIADGMFFSESGAITSCMDLSDGLGISLAQMAAMTKLSYQIDEAALPRYFGLASLPPAGAKALLLYYGGA